MSSTIVTSVVTGGSNNHSTVSSEANAYATDFVAQGVLGTITNTSGSAPSTGSFAVNQDASPDMGVTVSGSGNTGSTASVAYITCTPASQDKQVLRARMSADYTGYVINANSSGSTVYDWIYLKADPTNAGTPSAAADNVVTLFTSRSTSNSADNGSPPTYGVLLAVVTVANGASSISNANISDKRTQVSFSTGVNTTATNGWTALGQALTYSANNGNKEFQVTASTDLTSTLSVGMKLKVSRSVTPPTQSAAFVAASSQYATKASPSGITFTGPFTAEAWIYLNSYTAAPIIGRRDNTGSNGGWSFEVTSKGQVRIMYGTTTNFTDFITYQSIPLYRWVHVAGVVTSVSSKTATLLINGQAVPGFSSLSASTTLTQQATDLRLAAVSGSPSIYFDGYMSEVRVWSTNQTTGNIQANMTKNLVGNETNLVTLYQLNGAWTDATSNANTLTASGGAVNNHSGNPYNATEYAFVNNVSYSNPTTTITLKSVGGTIPNMTLNNASWSVSGSPFGWPSVSGELYGHILLNLPFLDQQTTTSTSVVAFGGSNSSWTVTVPDNCSMLRIRGGNPSADSGSANTTAFTFYNGSTDVGNYNNTSANGGITVDTLVPVISGSTFTFNIKWLTTSGTATWALFTAPQQQGFWLEAA